ncbi:sensor histidine kinase [Caldimonas brevitalea]|uniref:histidine kinase n=1 Tax=Caldimonas brevitalea TaxID=413882 RepID=A0A0G3BNA5_9BURK|nr:ATP-binding protein [Caldimonas brevitalea]AKJ30934.1 phytochrome, two-component sensor histidine kinase [Caldimonas brevitalea]
MSDKDTVSILMVDDEPANLLALEGVLGPLGQRLVQAQSGAEALRRVLDDDFAVILLDVRMPDMSGIETATLIRSRRRSQTTPIIFLTGLEKSPEMMFEGYSAGAVDYLTKPVVPAILRAKVEVFIELERARASLKREIEQRERAAGALEALNLLLEKRNGELAAANAELDAFCAAVSHDLRTPLTHVEGFIDLLQASAASKLSPGEQQYVGTIRESTMRMRQLIGEFLRFSRLGATELTTAPVDMETLVRECLEQLQPATQGRRIEWRLEPLPLASGDQELLRQVWVNLLSNAVKYSQTRDPACITVTGEVTGDEVVYRVTDNGVGFDPARAGRLFSAFYRLHSGSTFEGVGVGLASVKRIVQRHHGRVWADSAPDQGATFCFALPRGVEPGSPAR